MDDPRLLSMSEHKEYEPSGFSHETHWAYAEKEASTCIQKQINITTNRVEYVYIIAKFIILTLTSECDEIFLET